MYPTTLGTYKHLQKILVIHGKLNGLELEQVYQYKYLVLLFILSSLGINMLISSVLIRTENWCTEMSEGLLGYLSGHNDV